MRDQTDTDHQAQRPTAPSPVLKQVLPVDGGFELPRWVLDHEYTLGRDPAGARGIALTHDGKVSKKHTRLRPSGDRVEVEDLGSKNGTFVDGHRVAKAVLSDGAVLRVGNTLFVLRHEPPRLADASQSESALHARILGQSPEVRTLRAALSQVARSVDPVVLLGPTGVGKELGARAIHELSARGRGPYEAVNCAAIPSGTAESELFGHEKGAFTGADRRNEGHICAAHGGTLFLDELAELPLDIQAKLLRALQPVEGAAQRLAGKHILRIKPVGGRQDNAYDVRLVAATNVDLQGAIRAGRFREDLWQRLAVLPVRFPSLDARRDDILALLHHFLNEGNAVDAPTRTISARLGELLLLHHWSGNVRELENVAKRLRLLAAGAATTDLDVVPDDLLKQLANADVGRPHATDGDARTKAESASDASDQDAQRPPLTREILERLLEEHNGNRSIVARLLKRDRKTIRRRMDELGIPRTWGRSTSAPADGSEDSDGE